MPLRDFMKQIVRAPLATSSENTSAASYSAEARTPSSSSSSGGFQIAMRRLALRRAVAVDQLEAARGRSAARRARPGWRSSRSPAGSAARCRGSRRSVAAAAARWRRASRTRRGRRAPRRRRRTPGSRTARPRRRWWGRIPTWSMSGLVSMRFDALADRRALGSGGVAVVDRGPDLLVQAERVQRARLVLRERLGRVQVERPRRAVGGQHLERRQLEAQRLARRGAGGDDRRRLERVVERLALVRVELVDPGVRERAPDRRSELARDQHRASRSGRQKSLVDETFIGAALFEQGRPRARCRARSPPLASMAVAGAAPRRGTPDRGGGYRGCYGRARYALPLRRSRRNPARPGRLAAPRRRRRVRSRRACARSRPAARADVEVVLYSGRRQSSVFEDSRLIGLGLVHLRARLRARARRRARVADRRPRPLERGGTIYEQIEASGAPALLLERFAGRLEYHTPWSVNRDVSHLFRGVVDLDEAATVLDDAGLGWLRLVDNGVIRARVRAAWRDSRSSTPTT